MWKYGMFSNRKQFISSMLLTQISGPETLINKKMNAVSIQGLMHDSKVWK